MDHKSGQHCWLDERNRLRFMSHMTLAIERRVMKGAPEASSDSSADVAEN